MKYVLSWKHTYKNSTTKKGKLHNNIVSELNIKALNEILASQIRQCQDGATRKRV